MKYKLSTLLLIFTSITLAVGWLAQTWHFRQEQTKWLVEKKLMQADFEEACRTIYSGSSAVSSADVASKILERLNRHVQKNNNDIFAQDTDRDFVDRAAIENVISLWKNQETISTSLHAVVPQHAHWELPKNIPEQIAKRLLDVLKLNTTSELIERAQELGEDHYFPDAWHAQIDVESTEFESLDQFVVLSKNAE